MTGRRAGLLVGALAAVWLGFLVLAVPAGQPSVQTWTAVFEHQRSRPEKVVAQMDGQAFAQQAVDPTFGDLVGGYRGDRSQAAYRAARPVQGWVDWLASLGGRRALLAPAILAVGVLALGMLPLALGAVADALGRRVRRPELVLLAPACVAFLRWPGLCEPLAAVLVLYGLARWLRKDQVGAIVLFSLAALTRETSLLVPVGVGLATVLDARRIRPALPLAFPAIAYAGWALVVRLRIGVFPTGSAQMGLPLQGLIQTVPHWGPAEVVTFALLVVAMVVVWRSESVLLRSVVLAHAIFLAFLGPLVWWYWWGFGRVTLPVFVLALVGARRGAGGEPTRDETPATAARGGEAGLGGRVTAPAG